MTKCTYCGTQIKPGTGKILVFKTSKIANFCSNKCEKNKIKLKRSARNFKWTAFYEKGN